MFRLIGLALLTAVLAGCGKSSAATGEGLKGPVVIDGSSTVYPITEAVAEEFGKIERGVRVTVGISGTGGGFKKFMAGETDISNASRYIKQKEIDGCAEAGVEYIELPVAYDGLAVVVNKKNDFVDSMTIDELNKMWSAESTATRWSEIRAGWPEREFRLYAPGQDSGTFDYFTEVINGKSGNCRADATFSEDDNVLVKGVSGDADGIGFFGFAYYAENQSILKVVPIDGGAGPVVPSEATIEDGSYSPLSRPLFIYVTRSAAEKPQVEAFIEFYMAHVSELAAEVGYVPFPATLQTSIAGRFEQRVTGTLAGQSGPLEQLYK